MHQLNSTWQGRLYGSSQTQHAWSALEPICFGACRFQQAELVHSRTAMLGVAGILFPAVRLL